MLGWCFIIIFPLNNFYHASGVRQFVSVASTLATTHEVGMFILHPLCRLGAQNLDPVAHWQTPYSHSGLWTAQAERSTRVVHLCVRHPRETRLFLAQNLKC